MSRTRSFLVDFKDFINKGNVVDLAVAVVIGGAFGKVVDAVVSLVMGNLLQPALKAANVAAIASLPAGVVIVRGPQVSRSRLPHPKSPPTEKSASQPAGAGGPPSRLDASAT